MFSPLFILKAAKQHSPNPANIQTPNRKQKKKKQITCSKKMVKQVVLVIPTIGDKKRHSNH
jgi:hypothetical protein